MRIAIDNLVRHLAHCSRACVCVCVSSVLHAWACLVESAGSIAQDLGTLPHTSVPHADNQRETICA